MLNPETKDNKNVIIQKNIMKSSDYLYNPNNYKNQFDNMNSSQPIYNNNNLFQINLIPQVKLLEKRL